MTSSLFSPLAASTRLWVVATIVLLVTAGCGSGRPERVAVAGNIVLDGSPLELPDGAVAFVQVVPAGARAASGEIDGTGRFELTTYGDEGGGDGCVAGTHRVAVTAYEQLGPEARRWLLPKKYSNRKTSDLTVTVDKPTDSLQLELTWDGGTPFVERTGAIEGTDQAAF